MEVSADSGQPYMLPSPGPLQGINTMEHTVQSSPLSALAQYKILPQISGGLSMVMAVAARAPYAMIPLGTMTAITASTGSVAMRRPARLATLRPTGLAAARARHPGRPLWIGGHSLGAQIAALAYAGDAELAGLAFAGSGVPHWRCFSGWQKPVALAAFGVVRGISGLVGHYPGKQIGFAGREARSVMREARSGGR